MSDIIILDKQNQFGLIYPSLEVRKIKFIKRFLYDFSTLLSLPRIKGYWIKLFPRVTEIIYYNNFKLNNNHYYTLFYYAKKDYYKFLYLLNQLFLDLMRDDLMLDVEDEIYFSNFLKKIIYCFEKYDLDYYYDIKIGQIQLKLDKVNIKITNTNLASLGNNSNYSECVDSFLGINSQQNFGDNLHKIYKIFENTLESKKSKLRMNKNNLNKIAELIRGKEGKDKHTNDEIERHLAFLIKPVHHNPENYIFTREEYIYWWLEINNFIHIINSIE